MIVWVVGGVDPTGGAGVGRDEATMRAFAPELEVVRWVTAQTRQGHGAPATATPTERHTLRARAAELPRPAAIKVGLVPAAVAEIVSEVIARHRVPRVVDPVLAASDGGRMGVRAEALAPVLDRASLITPNRLEAAQLTGATADDPGLLDALVARWPRAWILLKDGHGADPRSVCDRLAHGELRRDVRRPRLPGPDPRGTGCALASAIAAGLARGREMPAAVAEAVVWLDEARIRATAGPDGRFLLP